MEKSWQQISLVFNDRAKEYDSWFNDSQLFTLELAALQELATGLPFPRLEIGVGPGRFAEQLNIAIGIDPAPAALRIAADRGIMGIAGIGEQLPLKTESMGTICMFFTLCFLTDPLIVLRECRRVLRSNGMLLLGFIPALSPWGKELTQKKLQRHPYYRYADFKTTEETVQLLQEVGFSIAQTRSTLLQHPDTLNHFEKPQSGLNERAGFCALTAENRKPTR
jgi:ubiquinone/menaquinone biosynthesis C-methylase UbiE